MTPSGLLALCSALFALLIALVAYVWRDMKSRVDEMDKAIKSSSQAVLEFRCKRLEESYTLLHRWKNEQLPAQFERLNTMVFGVTSRIESESNRRLERIERYLNGNLK